MENKYHIGCSGYYYAHWKSRFYPKGMPAKEWLAFYSTKFGTVELNGTFYRIPKVSVLKNYAAITPADFKFSVKINKQITHFLQLNESQESIKEFIDTMKEGLGDKLSCFLFQLPPSFKYNEENLERVLKEVPHDRYSVVEFRHKSWWNDEVKNAFIKAKLTFCNVDYPGFTTPTIITSDLFYFRFHGHTELFKSTYSKIQLKNFYDTFPSHAKDYYIYFNNTFYEGAYTNALELEKIIKG
jgi:uncharacterized protein YecE (DUF72 family)